MNFKQYRDLMVILDEDKLLKLKERIENDEELSPERRNVLLGWVDEFLNRKTCCYCGSNNVFHNIFI